jgi:hypothetical protein
MIEKKLIFNLIFSLWVPLLGAFGDVNFRADRAEAGVFSSAIK